MLLSHGIILAVPEAASVTTNMTHSTGELQWSLVSAGNCWSQMLPPQHLAVSTGEFSGHHCSPCLTPPASLEANVSLTNWLRGSWSYKAELHLSQLWFTHMHPWHLPAQCGGLRQGTLHKLFPQAGLEHVGPGTSLAHKYLLISQRQKGLTQCSVTSLPKRLSTAPLIPFKNSIADKDITFLTSNFWNLEKRYFWAQKK